MDCSLTRGVDALRHGTGDFPLKLEILAPDSEPSNHTYLQIHVSVFINGYHKSFLNYILWCLVYMWKYIVKRVNRQKLRFKHPNPKSFNTIILKGIS